MRLYPKEYQRTTLDKLGEYCDAVRREILRGSRRPERDAFEQVAGRNYFSPPGFDGIPYVCLRLPTGGGKTLLAAHAVGTVGRHLLGTDRPVCLWITPTTTIRDQTRRKLQDKKDPHRLALVEALGPEVEVITLEEALSSSRSITGSVPAVIVTTIQSYRVKEDRGGQEFEANRRIFRDNGYLQRAFSDIPPAKRAALSQDESGLVNLSLANALMLRDPIVIIDEAHNARTPTSFESLTRFGPSCVIELTATPQTEHDPARELYASNVLHAVSALELKTEGMIKLPVDLESRSDWLEVLAASKQRREELELKADEYSQEGGPPIRPIALIQAQPHSRSRETQTPEVVKKALIERLGIAVGEVRICTGTLDEIGEENLMAPECRVNYVITVDKLREGWDCPFAYILASIGNAATPTAVEQLLGRVMRQPFALPTHIPALDRAYAFVLSDNVIQTAMQLRDGLIQSCGFDQRSAEDALRVTASTSQAGLSFGRIRLSQPPSADALPDSLRSRATYNVQTQVLELSGTLNRFEAAALRDAVHAQSDKEAVEAYWEREREPGTAARRIDDYAQPLRVPQLSIAAGDARTLFEPEELDTFSWNLDACTPEVSSDQFSDDLRVGSAAIIDVEDRHGGLFTESTGEVRLRELELIGEGEDWTEVELARWLDSELHRDDTFVGLSKSESQPWMHHVVELLVNGRGLSLPLVVRRRHELSELLRGRVAAHGRAQARAAMQQLIRENPVSIETSAAVTFEIEETRYAPYNRCENHTFRRHAFQIVGAMNDDELKCAIRLDSSANVKRWVRNAEREAIGGFCLPKSPGKFFPDFVAELVDGTILVVEYKMPKMSNDPEELHKKAVGELWAARSSGKCRFAWIVGEDWASLDRQLIGSA
jgi:type III restriction enzyme